MCIRDRERAAQLRKVADQPVMLVGGVRTLEDMAAVLDRGIEMVSLCRPFIRQADLLPRLRAGDCLLYTSRCV